MNIGPLSERIVAAFDDMSGQLQTAARYVLDHPRDVALLSMREQARLAGVQPATMTRLAKHLGLDGFDGIRELYVEAVRRGDLGFAGKADIQVSSQRQKGERAIASQMLQSVARQIEQLSLDASLDQIVAVAGALAAARRVYCLGLRSSHSVAWHLHYVLTLIGERSLQLDALAGTGADALVTATSADVLFVASVMPYTRQSMDLADYARSRGVRVVAITDSEVAPLAQIADHSVLVPTDSPSFFHTMSPAFVIAEVLAALLAGQGGEEALQALRRTDDHLAALNTHLTSRQAKKST